MGFDYAVAAIGGALALAYLLYALLRSERF